MTTQISKQQLEASIEKHFQEKIIPTLEQYIKIPCKSPAFDKQWEENGYLAQAVKLFTQYIEKEKIQGLT